MFFFTVPFERSLSKLIHGIQVMVTWDEGNIIVAIDLILCLGVHVPGLSFGIGRGSLVV